MAHILAIRAAMKAGHAVQSVYTNATQGMYGGQNYYNQPQNYYSQPYNYQYPGISSGNYYNSNGYPNGQSYYSGYSYNYR
jgi:hypothetical protein